MSVYEISGIVRSVPLRVLIYEISNITKVYDICDVTSVYEICGMYYYECS